MQQEASKMRQIKCKIRNNLERKLRIKCNRDGRDGNSHLFFGSAFFSPCFWLSNLRQVHLAVWQAAETFNLILIIAQECAQNRKWNKMLAKATTTTSQILLTLLLTELCHLAEHFPGQSKGGSGVQKSLAQHRNCRCCCCWVRSLHKNANWSGLMRSPDLLDLN